VNSGEEEEEKEEGGEGRLTCDGGGLAGVKGSGGVRMWLQMVVPGGGFSSFLLCFCFSSVCLCFCFFFFFSRYRAVINDGEEGSSWQWL